MGKGQGTLTGPTSRSRWDKENLPPRTRWDGSKDHDPGSESKENKNRRAKGRQNPDAIDKDDERRSSENLPEPEGARGRAMLIVFFAARIRKG